MTYRKPIVGGNWKMNLHRQEAVNLAQDLASRFTDGDKTDVVVFPPFPYLTTIREALGTSQSIRLGAQNFYAQPNGAFTGEVSLSMLKDIGVQTVLVGHSERRHVIGENDVMINGKVRAALSAQMDVILCVGEKLEQRELGQTDAVNAAQTQYGLAGVSAAQMDQITIAYEPVWAIGTGKTATTQDAQNAHKAIRNTLATMFDDELAQTVRIQYGGSVKPSNAEQLFGENDIDGGLIGGASLKAEDFLAIVEAAVASIHTTV